MDLTAVHDAAHARVGQTTTRELGVIQARDAARFATAVGLEPKTAGVPPLYLTSVLGWTAGPEEADLPPDGALPDQLAGLRTDGVRLMGAGQDVEFLHPVEAGMAVTEETAIRSVDRKDGRSGPLLVLEVQRTFTSHDTTLLRCVETFVVR